LSGSRSSCVRDIRIRIETNERSRTQCADIGSIRECRDQLHAAEKRLTLQTPRLQGSGDLLPRMWS